MNRVNPDAIAGLSTREAYLNPGGDGLWPAPEGTCFGYQYATGDWRVSPGLSSALSSRPPDDLRDTRTADGSTKRGRS